MAAQHLKSKGKDDFISWQEASMLFSPSSTLQVSQFRLCAATRPLFWSPQWDPNVWVHHSYTLAPSTHPPSYSSLMRSSRASKIPPNKPHPKPPWFHHLHHKGLNSLCRTHHQWSNTTLYNSEQQSLTMLWSDCPLHVTQLIFAACGN